MSSVTVKEPSQLFDFLHTKLGYKRTNLKKLLKFKSIYINGKPACRHDAHLQPGDIVQIQAKSNSHLQVDRLDVKILFEDDSLIVAEKPAGLLTIATDKVKERTAYHALTDYMKQTSPARKKQLFIVHRIDKEVSGLLVFAKNPLAKERLQSNWRNAEKRYYAVVEGIPRDQEGTISSFLSENQFLKVYSGPKTPEAQLATTHYRVAAKSEKYALLEIELETGRKHQIRVHLSDIGHPILGDEKYGALEKVPKDLTDSARRIALHAFYLAFDHPVTRKRMEFTSRPPAVFGRLVALPK